MHRECACASLLRLSLFSLVFQSVIARLDPESCSHALEPDRDTGSLLQVAVAPGRSSIDIKEDDFLARAGMEEKKRFWWKLTQDLDKKTRISDFAWRDNLATYYRSLGRAGCAQFSRKEAN